MLTQARREVDVAFTLEMAIRMFIDPITPHSQSPLVILFNGNKRPKKYLPRRFIRVSVLFSLPKSPSAAYEFITLMLSCVNTQHAKLESIYTARKSSTYMNMHYI